MGFLRFLSDNRLFLGAGVLLSFTSSYGQTFFISLYAGVIMTDYGLSHSHWGLIYSVSTTCSAIAMIWIGALTDRFRVRSISVVACSVLAASCLAMTIGQSVWLLLPTIFLLRLTGQGMMSHLGVVAMARWFDATRGRALSISAMGFALGQALLPILFVSLMEAINWRWLWVLAAAIVLATTPLIYRLLREERTPQSVSSTSPVFGMSGRNWTRREMMHHWLFWAMVPLLLGPPAWGTALFFQQVHLTETKGWALLDFVALLPLYTITAIVSTFATGALIDRFGTGLLMKLYLVPFALAFLMMSHADSLWNAAIAMMILGLGTGAQATVPAAFWAEFYGTRYLGSIKALSSAIMVFGSALGPGITSMLIDTGIDFNRQMVAITIYFTLSAALSAMAISRARLDLTAAAKINVIGT